MAKGGNNERDVSKFLTMWLSGKTKPYLFWRAEASGGLATIHIENIHMTGDIKSIHPDSKFFTDIFSIELKTGYPKTSFWQHFTSSKFGVEEFWKQSSHDAQKADKHPMLIYRKKGRKQIIGIDKYIHKKLKNKLSNLNHIVICWNEENSLVDCVLYDMNDFFEKVKPDDIRKLK